MDLLWFGTWKNGAMDWTPNWVKSDPKRFPRVIDRSGSPIRVLSPHSRTTLEADKKAYVTMMKHLREVDEAYRTVILMQVENEPGILGSVRDYSPESNRLFNGPVPAKLATALSKQPGSWKEVFGRVAEEAFTAYYLSSYINEVAHAGKQVYPLVTYVNNWNGGYNTNDNAERWDRPGESYPSGGSVSHMLDLWKANAPDIDMLGSDTSSQASNSYRLIAAKYARPDNPRWSPEAVRGMTGARNCFYALADFSAIGFGSFGVDGFRHGFGSPVCGPRGRLPAVPRRHAGHHGAAAEGQPASSRRRRPDPGPAPDFRPLRRAGAIPPAQQVRAGAAARKRAERARADRRVGAGRVPGARLRLECGVTAQPRLGVRRGAVPRGR